MLTFLEDENEKKNSIYLFYSLTQLLKKWEHQNFIKCLIDNEAKVTE